MYQLNLFHILFVAPLLIYSARTGQQLAPKLFLFKFLLAVGILVLLYHSYLFYMKTM